MTDIRIVIRSYGAPKVLETETFEASSPSAGEVLLRQSVIGFNFLDVYQRNGAGALPLPAVLGHEAVGFVEKAGSAVEGFAVGDRVAYATAGPGAYATRRVVPAEKLVKPPHSLSDETVAAVLFKGLTAQYLVRHTREIGPDDVVVVHAAAGGVGALLVEWCKGLGAKVIGVTSSVDKLETIMQQGADGAALLGRDDLPAVVQKVSGRKATVVYDSVGQASFEQSVESLGSKGLLVCIGAASGPFPPIDVELLNRKGGLFVTRSSVFHHNGTPQALRENAEQVFAAVREGRIKPQIGSRFALVEAAQAHTAAEARQTTAAVVLQG